MTRIAGLLAAPTSPSADFRAAGSVRAPASDAPVEDVQASAATRPLDERGSRGQAAQAIQAYRSQATDAIAAERERERVEQQRARQDKLDFDRLDPNLDAVVSTTELVSALRNRQESEQAAAGGNPLAPLAAAAAAALYRTIDRGMQAWSSAPAGGWVA